MTTFTVGAHNLHDEAGVPTFFADVLFFTEAIAPTIRAKAARQIAHAKARLAGYSIIVCPEQRDLVIAYRRRLFRLKSRSYTKYVDGWAKVTPNRGTFVVFAEHRASGVVVPLIVEHRINAAFPPYVRSQGAPHETAFRKESWAKHTNGTEHTIDDLKASGHPLICAGGDLNVPLNVSGYDGHLHELGAGRLHFDRLGCSQHISGLEVLSRSGSDHNRIRAKVTAALPKEKP